MKSSKGKQVWVESGERGMSSQLPSLSGAVWIAVTAPGMGFDSTQEVFLTRKCTQALGPRGHLGTAHMSDISYLVSSLSTMT